MVYIGSSLNIIAAMLISALLLLYCGHVFYKILLTELKRKHLEIGDVCNVYIGERKLKGFVLKVNHGIDIWLMDKVIRFSRKDVYA